MCMVCGMLVLMKFIYLIIFLFLPLVFSLPAGKASSSSTPDPSGVLQGIPSGVEDDSIASLHEDDPMPAGMTTFHPSSAMEQPIDRAMNQTMSQPIDHDEEMFKGEKYDW